jgi:hypothetical protein
VAFDLRWTQVEPGLAILIQGDLQPGGVPTLPHEPHASNKRIQMRANVEAKD